MQRTVAAFCCIRAAYNRHTETHRSSRNRSTHSAQHTKLEPLAHNMLQSVATLLPTIADDRAHTSSGGVGFPVATRRWQRG